MAEQFQVTTDPEMNQTYRTSITSSVLNYKYGPYNRCFSSLDIPLPSYGELDEHAYREGEYALPNDEEEQERMDLLHHIYSLILDGEIHIAPIKTPQRVLDIGTGTGIWASSEVIGNDLSPIQPRWQAFAHLHPGGFFEIQSFTVDIFSDDGSIEKAPYTEQVVSLVQEASAKFGKPMDNLDTWPAAMKEAGFTDVVCKIVKAPSSPWAKDPKQMEIGRFFQAHQVHSVPAYTNVLLSKVLGWSKTEIDILNMHVLRESKNLEVHQYGKLYLIYGRKPL
ncbi:S-adenosyl-L-methionine-dependent methyltransferase [Aspergillus flavus]|uniref:S-adenosyl-L-methionine-dependent methyltransferase n=1 Tax=Aspergillus flavus (strain ATCC 200026 / FGSC A1120 / IAM 13836 / NRRL 3357 / JCM 12722 / SRRC 167) TaxID=332952 RepID=A0A7U2MI13_ASPFN|nr:S-adenosyl-L-methionine-dependent methyltransferase [Aspergillus flavus]